MYIPILAYKKNKSFNPFYPTGHFLPPLQASKVSGFLMFSRDIEWYNGTITSFVYYDGFYLLLVV